MHSLLVAQNKIRWVGNIELVNHEIFDLPTIGINEINHIVEELGKENSLNYIAQKMKDNLI